CKNAFQIYRAYRCRDPDFSIRASSLFLRTTPINEGVREFKKQANLAVTIFFVPYWMCCCLRRIQVSLDVLVLILNARPSDGSGAQRTSPGCAIVSGRQERALQLPLVRA